MNLISKIKNLLKHILPPPVASFMREINSLRELETKLNQKLNDQLCRQSEQIVKQQEQIVKQQEQIVKQQEQIAKQQEQMAKQQKVIEDLLKKFEDSCRVQRAMEKKLEEASKKLSEQNKMLADRLPKPIKRDYDYYRKLPSSRYEKELELWFKKRTGEMLNLEYPETFNEKIQWLKLYDSTPLKTRLADKYLVRDWIKEKIGGEYLVPLLGVWDTFDEIDFEQLPNQFVLKTNHGSSWNLIVTDKALFDRTEAKKNFDTWMEKNFAFIAGFELHYMNITPKIVAEKYIADMDTGILDFRFFCFNGEPKYVWLDSGSGTTDHRRNVYDMNWVLQDYRISYPKIEPSPPKPETFDKMVELAKTLCESFAMVRVDFYSIDKKIYFGEMTFTPQSGCGKWDPPEQNLIYGRLLQLPEKSPIPKRMRS